MQANLIQARFLFEKAQSLWEPYRDISNGMVVSLLQDASELVTWALVKAHSVQVKDQEGFVSILEKISASGRHVHGKAQILELNKSRVVFKHYGIVPSPSDIPRFIEGAWLFLNENVKEHLGQDFSVVSLADEVSDAEARNYLKEAERFRDEGNLDEALISVSLAFQRVKRVAKDNQFAEMPSLRDIWDLFPEASSDDANLMFAEIESFLANFSTSYAMLALGVNRSLLEEIEERRVSVNVSEGGKRLGVYRRQRTTATIENTNFLIANVTDIARRLTGFH